MGLTEKCDALLVVVLEETGNASLGEDPIQILTACGFVFIPRGTVHAYKNMGSQTGIMTSLMTPGRFVDFWEELSKLPSGKGEVLVYEFR